MIRCQFDPLSGAPIFDDMVCERQHVGTAPQRGRPFVRFLLTCSALAALVLFCKAAGEAPATVAVAEVRR